MKRTLNAGGFTMIELIIVVAIISVLAVLAVEHFIDVRTKAQENTEAYTVKAVQSGINLYHANEVINP